MNNREIVNYNVILLFTRTYIIIYGKYPTKSWVRHLIHILNLACTFPFVTMVNDRSFQVEPYDFAISCCSIVIGVSAFRMVYGVHSCSRWPARKLTWRYFPMLFQLKSNFLQCQDFVACKYVPIFTGHVSFVFFHAYFNIITTKPKININLLMSTICNLKSMIHGGKCTFWTFSNLSYAFFLGNCLQCTTLFCKFCWTMSNVPFWDITCCFKYIIGVMYLYWSCIHAFIVFQMKLRCQNSFIQMCMCRSCLHTLGMEKFTFFGRWESLSNPRGKSNSCLLDPNISSPSRCGMLVLKHCYSNSC